MKKILIITLMFCAITFGLSVKAVMQASEQGAPMLNDNQTNTAAMVELKPVEIYLFVATGCPHCASLELYLAGLQQEFPQLSVKKFDLRADPQSITLCQKLAESCNGTMDSVPMTFIGNDMIVGDRQTEIRQKIELCVAVGCPSPIEMINTDDTNINPSASSGSSDTNQTNWKQNFAAYIILGILAIVLGGFIIFYLKSKKGN